MPQPLWQRAGKGNHMDAVMDGSPMNLRDVAAAIVWQADHAAKNGAPATSRVVRAQLALLGGATEIGRRLAAWPGKPLEDALPLRLAGGFHHLVLSGADTRLAAVYRGELTDQAAIDALVADISCQHDRALLPWLDGPPQTNEAGRSASIMAVLLWLAPRVGPRFEMNELGASAGVNTMMERYFYDLGGTRVGPESAPMRIVPEWRGAAPVPAAVEITAIQGCDRAPVNLADPAAALRLKSYVWAEVTERLARIDAAIALAGLQPPHLVQMDAGDWALQRLAAPQEADTTRVIYHSIVWQYLPEETRARIEAAMARAGAAADASRRLAWIMLETNRQTFAHELTVRYWPGGGEAVQLGTAHAHGAWVEWRGNTEGQSLSVAAPETLYRPYIASDEDAVLAHILAIQRDEFGVPVTAEDQPDLREVQAVYQSGTGGFWVAEQAGRIVGTIGLIGFGEGEGALRKMFVAAEARGAGQGVGARLLALMVEHARAQGIKAITLGTVAKLQAARRFYEKNGFFAVDPDALPKGFPRMPVDTHFYRLELA